MVERCCIHGRVILSSQPTALHGTGRARAPITIPVLRLPINLMCFRVLNRTDIYCSSRFVRAIISEGVGKKEHCKKWQVDWRQSGDEQQGRQLYNSSCVCDLDACCQWASRTIRRGCFLYSNQLSVLQKKLPLVWLSLLTVCLRSNLGRFI